MKEHWNFFTHWWLNNVIRMDMPIRAIVLPIMMIVAFGSWAWAFKLTKKDLKGFPYFLYIFGALTFGLAMWIIFGS